ncbi:MAG: MFS transporter [Candidatus Sumerlaeia bacterium]
MSRLRLQPLDWACAMAFIAYSCVSVVTPICLLKMAEELHFNLAEGGVLEAGRTFLLVIILGLSGFAAAHWGKTRVIGFSLLLMGAGMIMYSMAPTYAMVLMAMGLAGLGSGMVEGLVNPLIQDLHPRDSGRYLNLLNGFWSIGVLTTMLGVGELLTRGVSWRAIMVGAAVVCFFSGLLFLLLERRKHRRSAEAFRDTLRHTRHILGDPLAWLFMGAMFLAGGVEGGFTFWVASYVQIEFEALPRAGGIGTSCFAAGMIIGRFASGHFFRQHHLKALIISSALCGMAISIAIPFLPGLAGLYVMLFAAGLTVACFWPSLQSYAVDCLQKDSTMIFILLSMGGIPGFGATVWLMGEIGDTRGLGRAFFIIPFMFATLAALMVFTRSRKVHTPGDEETPLPDAYGGANWHEEKD